MKVHTTTVCVSVLDPGLTLCAVFFFYVFSEWGPQRGSSEEIPALVCLPGGEDWWAEERGGEDELNMFMFCEVFP